VIANVDSPTKPGPISATRYRIYGELFAELSQSRY
jgi:ribosome biogenesis GTPase / thiamine phosphate phosphatase